MTRVTLQINDVVAAFKKAKVKRPAAASWKGRCYEMACALIELKLIEGVPRYGHWLGPVKRGTLFYKTFAADAPVRHGWAELPDGQICDPTRWVFEGCEPYIFIGVDAEEYYDVGGDHLRMQTLREKPAWNKDQKQFDISKAHNAYPFLFKLLGPPPYCLDQVFWLANLPRAILGQNMVFVYAWIKELGHVGYIPIDNRRLCEEYAENKTKKIEPPAALPKR